MIPGQSVTKKLFKKYGEKLSCVHHRYDSKRRRKINAVEIIIEEGTWKTNSHKIPGNKLVHIHTDYKETYLRKLVKEVGGRWDGEKKLWEMPYKEYLDNYLKFGLGSMPKSDIDALLMHLLDMYGLNSSGPIAIYSNQTVSECLKTPVTKIKKYINIS